MTTPTKTPSGSGPTCTPRKATASPSLKAYTADDLEQEHFDLVAKVVELLEDHKLWGDDDTYTFTDGERWARFNPEGE